MRIAKPDGMDWLVGGILAAVFLAIVWLAWGTFQ